MLLITVQRAKLFITLRGYPIHIGEFKFLRWDHFELYEAII